MIFNYEKAFSRTVGLVTRDELQMLRSKTVAIAGMGGVGGAHLLTLARLGIASFRIADFDLFEMHNFNRQAGAYMPTIGRPKVEVMKEMALAINPEARIDAFADGVTPENLLAFFAGVDLYVDGIDFFAFQARQMIFDHCFKSRIPIVTAGPIAMGAALLNFLPGGMSPSAYFDWQVGDDDETLGMKFLIGLTPSMPHRKQIIDRSAVSLAERRGPSTPMACELCAGVAGTEAMKILLKRGTVQAAPHSLHFDAFENRYHKKLIWLGNRNPIQRLKIALGLREMRKSAVSSSERKAV